MAARSHWRGYPMEWVDDYGEQGAWLYSDTKTPVSLEPNRGCGSCGLPSTEEGHDGCLGTLPGVRNACCGHGTPSNAYIQYEGGPTLRGKEALKRMARTKCDKCGDMSNSAPNLVRGRALGKDCTGDERLPPYCDGTYREMRDENQVRG